LDTAGAYKKGNADIRADGFAWTSNAMIAVALDKVRLR
jgi:hypothetical protein